MVADVSTLWIKIIRNRQKLALTNIVPKVCVDVFDDLTELGFVQIFRQQLKNLFIREKFVF